MIAYFLNLSTVAAYPTDRAETVDAMLLRHSHGDHVANDTDEHRDGVFQNASVRWHDWALIFHS